MIAKDSMLITSYHDTAFDHDRRLKAVKRVTGILRRYPREVGIVCTGLSGIMVGTAVAERTKRDFAIVRKPGEITNSSNAIEGYTMEKFVIVDDFMQSGATIERILTMMNKRYDCAAECVSIILYDGWHHDSYTFKKCHIPVFGLSTSDI